MSFWVRVAADLKVEDECGTRLEVSPRLNLTVYISKEHARLAQEEAGGIILEISSASLKEVENEFKQEVLLTSGSSGEGLQPSTAAITFCYDGLSCEDRESFTKFGPDAEAYLTNFEAETGFSLHQ